MGLRQLARAMVIDKTLLEGAHDAFESFLTILQDATTS